MNRLMGLDVGSKTIGVAISDPLFITAQSLETIQRTDLEKDLERLEKIIVEYSIIKIVVGLPYHMNYSLGKEAQRIMNLTNRLRDRTGIEVVYQDERLSTKSANQVLMESKVRREKRKAVIDKIAASYILQTYLDRGF